MRVAAIYDIHGNLPALEAVLQDVRRAGVEQVVVGGDVIPGPMPGEAIDLLLEIEIPVHFICGNGGREVLAQRRAPESHTGNIPEQFREAMRWVGEQVTADQAARLAGWPETVTLQIPGSGQVCFCHATPRSDAEIFTSLTPEDQLLPIFAPLDVGLVGLRSHAHAVRPDGWGHSGRQRGERRDAVRRGGCLLVDAGSGPGDPADFL